MVHGMDGLLLSSAQMAGLAVSAGLEGLVLTAGVAMVLRLAPGLTAAARAAIWSGVLLVVVLLHLAPLAIGASGTKGIAETGHAIQVDVRWGMALACVWAMCSLVRGTRLAMSAVRLRRLACGATLAPTNTACTALLMAGGRRAQLCVSNEVDRPSVAGFLRPRILLPQELLAALSPTELEQIVIHEMEHLRRRDDWMNLLQKLCLAVFPLNPALLWVERRVCAERELACDDRVLRLRHAPKAYATCLTNLAEHRLLRRGVSLALGAWERQAELTRRVQRILAGPVPVLESARARMATGLVALTVLAGGAVLARSPQAVSFAPMPSGHEATASLRDVSARDGGLTTPYAGRPMMVNAVMRGPGGVVAQTVSAVVKPQSRRSRRGSGRQVRARAGRAPMMLSGWSARASRRPDLYSSAGSVMGSAPGSVRMIPISFAAVPFGNGWLIVQL